jgi:hypothetical protein
MNQKKKLFKVSFVDYSDKEMYVMALTFDDAEQIALLVKNEISLQEEEKLEEESPALDEEGNIYKESISAINIFFEKEKKTPEVSSVSIVSKVVYGMETDDM